MIGQFGDVIFEVSGDKIRTFENFQIDKGSIFASHNMLNSKPKLQHTGYDLNTVSLDILFKISSKINPKRELEEINKILLSGESKNLILGNEVIGKYVLESISEMYEHIDNKGRILGVKVQLKLKEYV